MTDLRVPDPDCDGALAEANPDLIEPEYCLISCATHGAYDGRGDCPGCMADQPDEEADWYAELNAGYARDRGIDTRPSYSRYG